MSLPHKPNEPTPPTSSDASKSDTPLPSLTQLLRQWDREDAGLPPEELDENEKAFRAKALQQRQQSESGSSGTK